MKPAATRSTPIEEPDAKIRLWREFWDAANTEPRFLCYWTAVRCLESLALLFEMPGPTDAGPGLVGLLLIALLLVPVQSALVIRLGIPSIRWGIATVFGILAGFLFSVHVVRYFFEHLFPASIVPNDVILRYFVGSVLIAASNFIGGAIRAIPQALFALRHIPRAARRWILFCAAVSAPQTLMAALAFWFFHEFCDLVRAYTAGRWPGMEFAGLLSSMLVGLLYGLLTGVALVWLTRSRPERHKDELS